MVWFVLKSKRKSKIQNKLVKLSLKLSFVKRSNKQVLYTRFPWLLVCTRAILKVEMTAPQLC